MTPKSELELETGSFDQTRFAEESVVFGAKQAQEVTPLSDKKPRSRLTLALLIGLPLVLVLFVLTLLLSPGGQNGLGMVVESPTPEPTPTSQSELQRRFAVLESEISLADPSSALLAFPPIDFTLILEDATALRQRRAR